MIQSAATFAGPVNRTIHGLLAALLLTTGCSGGASDGSRRIEAVDWDTVFVIGGGVNDTTLIRPWLLTAGPGGLFIFDYGSSAVKAFDLHGRHRWTRGRPGSGPNEFRNPIGMTIAPDGRVWLVDSGAGRIAVLDPAGTEHALLPLPETPQQLVHVGSRTLAVLFASDWGSARARTRRTFVMSWSSRSTNTSSPLHALPRSHDATS
jgi:hypothetical protein